MRTLSSLICCLLLLAACEQLGIEDPAKITAAKDAEGKAVGSACRYSARTIEECYSLNPRAVKAAIFAGWLTMDGYMRDNKIEAPPAAKPVAETQESKSAKPAAKPDKS